MICLLGFYPPPLLLDPVLRQSQLEPLASRRHCAVMLALSALVAVGHSARSHVPSRTEPPHSRNLLDDSPMFHLRDLEDVHDRLSLAFALAVPLR